METKARDASPSNSEPPAETLAEAPRRRAGGQKRKAASSLSSAAAAAPSKRLMKERAALNLIPSIHNGPCTRARQSPNKFAAAAHPKALEAAPAAAAPPEGGGKEAGATGALIGASEDELVALDEPIVDAEFDAVRSRGSDVHVVPTPAGWFSWEEVHSLEKHTLTSFFNGKSENRTPEIYKEIRNSIMKKFHANPQTQLEMKDLSELSVGDLDARQEVMGFLDHWGLINFHPFPLSNLDVSNSKSDTGEDKSSSLIEKLYQFETVQSVPRIVPKKVEVSAAPPRFLSESTITDDLVGPVGPSVEYHCNSCSADCSRKRYHCQKQADFDLCSECYNSGKFGSGMAAADFILMEPADAPGLSGGSWTDQETLLLLEALELFGENWNEIAEHVATKTKAQCILHFLQMPIEDPFLEGNDDVDDNIKEHDPGLANKETTASSVSETKETENADGGEKPVSPQTDALTRKDDNEGEVSCETGASVAIDALHAAFQAIGYTSEQGGLLSFAEAGNPVMTLAAFLVQLVEPDFATMSSRSSLNAMSEDSPGIQLATRHCFQLDDPPSNGMQPPASESADAVMGSGEVVKEQTQMPISDGSDESKDCTDKNEKSAVPVENEKDLSAPLQDCLQKPPAEKESSNLVLEAVPSSMEDSEGPPLPGEGTVVRSPVKDATDSASPVVLSSSNSKEPGDSGSPGETAPSAVEEINDIEPTREEKLDPVKESDKLASGDRVEQDLDAPKSADTRPTSSPPEDQESPQKAGPDVTPESKETADGEDKKMSPSNDGRNCNSTNVKGGHNINRLKRAAVTVLSAAAVKSKLLARQEEDHILQLVSLIIEKQLHKLETKMALFSEIESVIMRVREQTDRARQRLIHERAQIIAARLGLPAPSSRVNSQSLPTNKTVMGYSATGSKPPTWASQKPPPTRRP